jgi:hypothetical protein
VRLHRIDENVSGDVAPLLAFLRERRLVEADCQGDHSLRQRLELGGTVLRRAGTAAADAGRVCLSHFRLLAILEANLVAPRNVQVVLVDELGALTELQRHKCRVRRGRR